MRNPSHSAFMSVAYYEQFRGIECEYPQVYGTYGLHVPASSRNRLSKQLSPRTSESELHTPITMRLGTSRGSDRVSTALSYGVRARPIPRPRTPQHRASLLQHLSCIHQPYTTNDTSYAGQVSIVECCVRLKNVMVANIRDIGLVDGTRRQCGRSTAKAQARALA